MSRRSLLAPLLLAILSLTARPTNARAQQPFDVVDLTDGVFAAVVRPDPPMAVFANALVVIGQDGVLVVDTHQSPSAARWVIEEIRKRTDRPVRWVVNTHWHGDHVYGNVAYREAFPNVEFVAHRSLVEDVPEKAGEKLAEDIERLPESIAERRGWLETGLGPDGATPLTDADRAAVTRSMELRSRYLAEIRELELVPPTDAFERDTALSLGDREVRIVHLGPAHTRGDVIVHLPDDGIVAVGDLLEEGVPWIDENTDVAGWSRALERIDRLDAAVTIPSHGAIQRDDELLETVRGVVSTLAEEARSTAVSGGDLEALRERLDLSPWRPRLTGGDPARDEALDRAIDRWTEIAWEQARTARSR